MSLLSLFVILLFSCFITDLVQFDSHSDGLKFALFNVKGLGNKEKRRIIFQWLKDKKVDICFIQEAHYTNECKVVWGKDWGGEMYFSGNDSRSMGVGIMFNPSFNMNVINSTEIVEGRALALNININEKTTYISKCLWAK